MRSILSNVITSRLTAPLLLPRQSHSHSSLRSNRSRHRPPRFVRIRRTLLSLCASLLLVTFPEAAEASFLLRVRDVDNTHRQLRESVCPPQRSPESMNVCDVHARPGTP